MQIQAKQSQVAISVRNLIKDFDVFDRPLDLALEVIFRRKRHRTFRALNDISFDVERGQVLGIIGANGAGKSTLLKILTGVLDATQGQVTVNGKVTAILELGLGFNPEYSGKENIYLSGLLYGMGREEIDRKLDEIIAFSGLRDFISQPLKTYSSGMHARLAFSIATAVEPEILIIDEALAAGDAAFVQKCYRRIRDFCRGGHTVILVSHGASQLAQLCHKIFWMDKGRIRMQGDTLEVIQAYDLAAHRAASDNSWIDEVEDDLTASLHRSDVSEAFFSEVSSTRSEVPVTQLTNLINVEASGQLGKQVFRRGPISIESVKLQGPAGDSTDVICSLMPFSLNIAYRSEKVDTEEMVAIAVAFNQADNLAPVLQWFSQNSLPEGTEVAADKYWRGTFKPADAGIVELKFDYMPLRAGDYVMSIGLLPKEPASWQFYEYRHLFYKLKVVDGGAGIGAAVFFRPTDIRHSTKDGKPETVESLSFSAPPASLREEINDVCVVKGGYPKRWPRHETCPVCKSFDIGVAFEKYGFAHDKCSACNFVFVNPYPPESVISAIYDGEYYTRVRDLFELPRVKQGQEHTPFSAPKEVLQETVRRIVGSRKTGRWLDIGGGIGSFASLIRELNPRWSVLLNEMNARSVEIAEQFYGLETLPYSLDELRQGEKFDVISSIAVLEHISDPKTYVESCLSLLKPGGQLLIVVPQFTVLNAFLSRAASPNVIPPFHLSLFNAENLMQMLKACSGVQTVTVDQVGSASFSLTQSIQHGDYWDIALPTPQNPEPLSVQRTPYSRFESRALQSLSAADSILKDHFADTDGRLLLVAYVTV